MLFLELWRIGEDDLDIHKGHFVLKTLLNLRLYLEW